MSRSAQKTDKLDFIFSISLAVYKGSYLLTGRISDQYPSGSLIK